MRVAKSFHAVLPAPLFVLLVSAIAIGCDDEDPPVGGRDSGVTPSGDATVDPGTDGAVMPMTEAEIAGVVNAIHASEIALVSSVEDRLTDDEIEAHAAMVRSTHTASAAEHEALLGMLGITPVESELSQQITQQAELLVEGLASPSGTALDTAYRESQVILDAELLEDLQTTLVPNATTRRYRDYLLFDLRELLVANLQAGRALEEDPTAPAP